METQSQDHAYFAPDARPAWRRLLSRLFPVPRSWHELDSDEPAGWAPGWLETHVVARLDWRDRLRVLVSGHVHVRTRTRTDVPVNRTLATSSVWIEPPFSG